MKNSSPLAGAVPADTSRDSLIVIGAGPVGCAMALAAGMAGFPTRLLDRARPTPDARTTALDPASVNVLRRLGLWDQLAHHACPIASMDVTGKPADADSVTPFGWVHLEAPRSRRAPDERRQPLGYMIENRHLHGALLDAVEANPAILVNYDAAVTAWKPGQVQTDGATFLADLVIAADGVRSRLRQMAGISVRDRSYGQKALTAVMTHSSPHHGIAYQRFDDGGPLALLPLLDDETGHHRSSIVWSDTAERVDGWLAGGATSEALEARLTQRLGAPVGELTFAQPPRAFPLTASIAVAFGGPRLVLIAEAAHHIHPLAGQGMNLGLRDVRALVGLLCDQRDVGGDLGSAQLIADYGRARQPEAERLFAVTDGLNGLFQAPKPVQHLARLGMTLVQESPLKKLIAREMTRV